MSTKSMSENATRMRVARRGYRLLKASTRDREHELFGTFGIYQQEVKGDPRKRLVIANDGPFGMTLHQVECEMSAL